MSKGCNCGCNDECCETVITRQGEQGPRGERGPIGANGTNGTNGTNGLSAYEVAVENGFVGTEQEWLDSLVGPPGADSPLVWESLVPYLASGWVAPSLPSAQPEFAYDSVKKLLYLRGLILTVSSVLNSDVLNVPDLVFDNDKLTSVYLPIYTTFNNGSLTNCQLGDLGGSQFSLDYIGPLDGESVFLVLDSVPVLRFS